MILGDKSAVEGGSGKVIDSKSDDRIFIYYSDHGGPGVLGRFQLSVPFWLPTFMLVNYADTYSNSGMPNLPYLYAAEFIEVLKKKHESQSYKEMVRQLYCIAI